MKTKKKKYKEPELYFMTGKKVIADCISPGSSNLGGEDCESTGPSAVSICSSTGTTADMDCIETGPSALSDCVNDGGGFI